MNTQSLPINPLKLRNSIQRMFNGTGRQILSEVLQNAQRAHANKLEIIAYYTEGNYYLTFKDNGQGLKTIEDYRKLVSLGDTGFDETVIKKQDPAGIGLNSILANEGCINLSIISGGYYLLIDREKWWNDLEYWKNWEQLLKGVYPVASEYNYTLAAMVTEDLFIDILEELRECTKSGSNTYLSKLAVTLGYSQYLEIILKTNCLIPKEYHGLVIICNESNNLLEEKLVTNVLNKSSLNILTETVYKGGKLVLFYQPNYTALKSSLVNWYGQLIKIEMNNCRLSFYYEYSDSNEPGLMPTHPTRDSIIQNTAYNELIDFVALTLVNYLNESIEGSSLDKLISVEINEGKEYKYQDLLIEAYSFINFYKLQAKYINLIKWLPVYNLDTYNIDIINVDKIDYTKTVIFIEDDVQVKLPDEDLDSKFCTLSNFVEDIPFANKYYLYKLLLEINEKLELSTLVWIVGDPVEDPYNTDLNFYELGELAIIKADQRKEQEEFDKLSPDSYTKIVNTESILAFEHYASCECLEFDEVCVSLKSMSTESVLNFISERLEELYSNDNFYYDDSSNNTLDSFYELVVNQYTRAVMGNCIKSDFTLWDLKCHVQSEDIPFNKVVVTTVNHIYDNLGTLISIVVTYTDSLENHLAGTAHYRIKPINIYK